MSFIKFLMEQRYNEGPFGIEPEGDDGDNRLDKMDAAIASMDDELNDQEELFLVPGIGQMTREQARKRAVSKIVDIAERAQDPNVDWSMIVTLLKDSGLHAYAKALATRHE